MLVIVKNSFEKKNLISMSIYFFYLNNFYFINELIYFIYIYFNNVYTNIPCYKNQTYKNTLSE